MKKGYCFTIALAEVLLIILGFVLLIAPEDLIRIFRDDAEVIEIGTRALMLNGVAQLVLPFCMVTEMLFQSTGKKLAATILSGSRNGIFFIPILLILAHTRGLAGIQEAQPLAHFISVIPAIIFAVIFFKKLPKTD